MFAANLTLLLTAFFSPPSLVEGKQQKPLHTQPASLLDADFDVLVKESLERWHVPGMAISIVDDGVISAKGYGIAAYPDTSVKPSTLFYTGSTTKAFTAAAISLLVDDTANSSSPLTWTTRLSSLIREDFVLPSAHLTETTTIEDALSHRTGMPRHDNSYGGPGFSVRDVVRSLRFLPMAAGPRERFIYCNMMYMAVSHAIEVVTGMWLGDFLRVRIWEPLGMMGTFFSLKDAKNAAETTAGGGAAHENDGDDDDDDDDDDGQGQQQQEDKKPILANGYTWDNTTVPGRYVSEPWLDMPESSGAGNVISNVLDYAVWIRTMINQDGPFSTDAHKAFRTARSFPTPLVDRSEDGAPPFTGPEVYTLGWQFDIYAGEPMYSHGGAVTGFGALAAFLPRKKWGVAMMGNEQSGANAAQKVLLMALVERLLRIEEEKRYNWVDVIEKQQEEKKQALLGARERLYPGVGVEEGGKIRKARLPLAAYTGVFNHPGYRNITINLAQPSDRIPLAEPRPSEVLHADVLDRTWPVVLDFEHITGEYFLVWASGYKTDGPAILEEATKAEFHIGEQGTVERLGINIEPEMGEEKIWFERVVQVGTGTGKETHD